LGGQEERDDALVLIERVCVCGFDLLLSKKCCVSGICRSVCACVQTINVCLLRLLPCCISVSLLFLDFHACVLVSMYVCTLHVCVYVYTCVLPGGMCANRIARCGYFHVFHWVCVHCIMMCANCNVRCVSWFMPLWCSIYLSVVRTICIIY